MRSTGTLRNFQCFFQRFNAMEACSPEICVICKTSMNDPRILPCYHSFCLKCLESSIESSDKSSNCPTCRIGFQIPAGGLKDLEKNLFIEQLKRYKLNDLNCGACNNNPAIKFCMECSCNYCSACLEHHRKLPISRNHQLQATKTNQSIKGKSIIKKYQTCEKHSEMMTLFCEDCKVILCSLCFVSKHKNHKIRHASEYFLFLMNKLKGKLKSKDDDIESIIIQQQRNAREIILCEEKSCKIKQEIQERGEKLKEFVDSIVVNLQKQVDELLNIQKTKLEKIIRKLEVLEKQLSEDIKILEEQLDGLNYENLDKISSLIKEEDVEIPMFYKHFLISLTPQENYEKSLTEIMGSILKKPQLDITKEVALKCSYTTFATNGTDLYFWNAKEFQVDVYSYDGMVFKSKFKLNQQSMEVSDLLLINNMLYIACICLNHEKFLQVYGIDTTLLKPFDDAKLIFELQYEGDVLKMSKSYFENVLLVLKYRLMELSKNGELLQIIDFPVSIGIPDALQINEQQFWLCCNNSFLVIDNQSKRLRKYDLGKYCLDERPYILSKDKFGNMYSVFVTDIVAFDYSFNSMSKEFICNMKRAIKMCYAETRNELFILMNDSQLLVMDL